MSESESPNPIEELFKMTKKGDDNISKELFAVNDGCINNIDLKTDVIYPEDVLISTLKFNDDFLVSHGFNPIVNNYLQDLLRVRFSLERQSRKEFVAVNTSSMSNFQMPGEFKSIEESRK